MADAQDQDSPLKPNETLDDTYLITEELGRGGIGVVYKAHDRAREEDVAIKVLLPTWAADRKMVERFLREGRLAIRARHPNIVQVYAIGRRKGSGIPYFVMELVEGETLLCRLKRARDHGTTIGMSGIHIGRQLLSALAATHSKGIVHRDLKPGNIIIVKDDDAIGGERAKLLDFGIAKAIFAQGSDGTLTSAGDQQPGTPAYMPPEQFSALDKDTDPTKMDVWALGVIFFQMLGGRLPFWSENRLALMMKIGYEEPEPLLKLAPSLPVELARLVHDLLSKSPAARPTMEQARQRLDKILGLGPSTPVALVLRPTAEIGVLTPPVSSPEGSGISSTLDVPAELAAAPGGTTAPPALPSRAHSVGERSTQPQPADGGLSSIGRGTGQQLTGAQPSGQQRRRALAVGASALLLIASSIATWRILRPAELQGSARIAPPVSAPSTVAVPAPPTPTAPAQDEADSIKTRADRQTPRPTAQATPPPSPQPPPAKEHKRSSCTGIEPTEACILGPLSQVDKRAFLTALDEADVKLCAGDSLTVVAQPQLSVTSTSGVRRIKKEHFELALRGAPQRIAFSGEVVVRCKTR